MKYYLFGEVSDGLLLRFGTSSTQRNKMKIKSEGKEPTSMQYIEDRPYYHLVGVYEADDVSDVVQMVRQDLPKMNVTYTDLATARQLTADGEARRKIREEEEALLYLNSLNDFLEIENTADFLHALNNIQWSSWPELPNCEVGYKVQQYDLGGGNTGTTIIFDTPVQIGEDVSKKYCVGFGPRDGMFDYVRLR